MILLENDLPGLLPIGQESLKRYLPSKKIYLSWGTDETVTSLPWTIQLSYRLGKIWLYIDTTQNNTCMFGIHKSLLSLQSLIKQWRRHKSNRFRLGKTTTLHMHHNFLYISLPSLHDCYMKMPNFTFCGECEHKTTTFFFFSWTLIVF